MLRFASVLAFVVVTTTACLSDSSIPRSADVTCSADDECPTGTKCVAGRCEDPNHLPPTLTITVPARASGPIDVDATLFDSNAATLSLSGNIVVDGKPTALTLTPANAKASANGTKVHLVATPTDPGLASSYHASATIEIDASDGVRTASAKAALTGGYGNDAPGVVDVRADPSTTRPGTVGGLVTVHVTISDSSSDPVDISELAVLDQTGSVLALQQPGDASAFPNGGLSGLTTSPGGAESTFTWDSAGVDLAATQASLRVTVVDQFGGTTTFASTDVFTLDNAPSVTFVGPASPAQHALTSLSLPWLIDDPNCASGDQTVTARFLLAAASGDVAGTTATTLANLAATALPITVDWNVAADATAGTIASAQVIVDPDGVTTALVPVQQTAHVKLTADDGAGLVEASGVVDVSIGNDPPVVALAPFAASGALSGDIPIAFSLADSGADPANVEVQFRKDASDTFRPIAVKAGVLTNLFTATTPASFLVLWDSRAAPDDVDVTAPQGIGHALLPNAEIRIRASDSPAAGVRHFSSWQTQSISLSNQTAPRVEAVLVGDQGGIRNGIVPIVWRAIDEESDPVDVAFEHSLDGVTFHACTEAPFAQSEGALGLASAPAAAGGVEHTFLWDTSADIFSAQPSVRLRARIVDNQAVKPTDAADAIPTFTLLQPAPFDPLPASGATGAFTLRTINAPNAFPDNFGFGDVDHDGKSDLIVGFSDATGPHLQVQRGDGSGGFTTILDKPIANIDQGPFDIADFDGDGNVDLFMHFDSRLLRGPAFNDAPPLAACAAGHSCLYTLADVDGDGIPDLLEFDNGALTEQLFAGAGRGVAYHVVATSIAVPSDGGVVAIGDYDGDGHPDLLIEQSSGFTQAGELFSVLRGAGVSVNGDASAVTFTPFGAPAPLPVFGQMTAPVDVDGDGKDDLFIDDDSTGILFLLHGNGDGTFTVVDSVESVTFPGFSHVLADFNGDGTPDIALSSETEQTLLVAITRSGGDGFIGSQHIDVGQAQFGIAGADFDGDGRPDFGAFLPSFNVANGQELFALAFSGVVPPPDGASASSTRSITPGSVNNATPIAIDATRSGALDFYVTTEFGDVSLAEGHKDGAVTTSWSTSYGPPPFDVSTEESPTKIVDVNHDGVADVITITENPNIVNGAFLEVWLAEVDADGIGDGTFTRVSSENVKFGSTLATGDIDGDGNVDFVIHGDLNVAPNAFTLFRGKGDGTFTASVIPIPSGAQFAEGFAIADWNRDGFDDLVVTEDRTNGQFATSGASVFVGSAAGLTFSSSFTFPFGGADLRIGDFDDDGLPDILAFGRFHDNAGDDLAILRANNVAVGAAPTFNAVRAGTSLPGGQIFAPVVADFDLDGALDCAYVMPDPFSTSIFFFPGAKSGDRELGALNAPAQILTNKNRTSLVSVDVTGDGVPDFVSGQFFGGNLDAFIGRSSLPFTSASRAVSSTVTSGASPSGLDVEYVDDAGGGFTQRSAIGLRRTSGANDVLAGIPASYGLDGGGGDLASLLRSQRVLTGNARPLTGAFYAGGDVRLVRVADPSAPGETRLSLQKRFGARIDASSTSTSFARAGMTLDDATTPRGVVVDLPMLTGRATSGAVRVLLGIPRWRTAADVASDPLHASANAATFLPKRNGNDVVDVRYDWIDVPAGSISSGTGKRFEVDAANKRVRVLTDELGVLQAFDEVSP